MDFEITPVNPDGICARVEFHVDTWAHLAALMRHLDTTEEIMADADDL